MNFEKLSCIATAAFGLEGIVAAELKRIGIKGAEAFPGGARFIASPEDAFRANMLLRCSDRVLMVLGEGDVTSFEELFQLVGSIDWEHILPRDAKINISGRCARSRLMSIRDCQSISKKAVIERLRRTTGAQIFPETGLAYPIDVAIHEDHCRITLDLSGEALNRRGYRTWNAEAPVRETLAAALVELSPWRPGMPLCDCCCGSGTLVIEAAFRAAHRAPGLKRSFAMEQYPFFTKTDFQAIRAQAEADFEPDRIKFLSGSDIDPEVLELARRHTRQADLEHRIEWQCIPLQELQRPEPEGVFLCNPPYGERLSDRKECEKLYHELRLLKDRHPGWSLCAISSDPGFERAFGKRADKKRRLYNGRLECNFYIYR